MRITTLLAAVVFLAGLASPARSQEASAAQADESRAVRLEPVLVNAEKRSQEAQKVPIGMTVMEGSDILDRNIDSTAALADQVPNLEFHDFGSRRYGLIFLRGIKSMPSGQAGIGFNVDGVNYNKSYMFGFPLFDVDRIEVLRGAQGTLYGRNTTGGVINVYTAVPTNESMSSVGTAYGNYGSRKIQASSSGPLIEDKLFVGIYGQAERKDGYMTNDASAAGPDGRQQEGMAARVKVRYLATEDWETTLSLDAQHHDDGAYPLRRTARNRDVQAGNFEPDEYYHYSHDFEGEQEVDFWGGSLDSRLQTSAGTFRSITGLRGYDSNEWSDLDFTRLDVRRQNLRQRDVDLSQEFRFVSPDSRTMRWLIGTYLFHMEGDGAVNVTYGDDAGANAGRETHSNTRLNNIGGALFCEATYTFLSELDLTLGLRAGYEHAGGESRQTDYPAGGAATLLADYEEQANYTSVLPKVSLAWHLSDGVMAYASLGKAHKSGGFNTASAPEDNFAYGEESSLLYEAGIKTLSFGQRLLLNLAAFYTDIEDEQLPLYQANLTRRYLVNAGKSHRLGLEVESECKLADAWSMSGSFSWIDARFDEYEDAANNIDYAGERVLCVPEYTFSLGLGYRDKIARDVDLFGRVDVSGIGPQYFDNANTVRQSAYELYNTRLGVQWDRFEAALWARNIFDQHYVAYENTVAGIAEDGAPRTFGLSLSYIF